MKTLKGKKKVHVSHFLRALKHNIAWKRLKKYGHILSDHEIYRLLDECRGCIVNSHYRSTPRGGIYVG